MTSLCGILSGQQNKNKNYHSGCGKRGPFRPSLFASVFLQSCIFRGQLGALARADFCFFLKFCVCGKSYLILFCGKSSRPVQPSGESQDIVSGDVIVKAEGAELAYTHFLNSGFVLVNLLSSGV